MSEKVIVKFTKPWRGYSPGEVAGFEESVAEALVGGGVASGYSPASAAASVSTQLTEKRVKAGDKKPTSRTGASKPSVDPLAPTVQSTSLEPTTPAGLTSDGVLGDAERELDQSVQASGTSSEAGTDPVLDEDDDDDGRP